MSERCAALTRDGGYGCSCTRKGTVQEGGKWWCKQHAPSLVRARRDERSQRWEEKWAEKKRTWAEQEATNAEVQHRADCYPDLLAALEELVALARPKNGRRKRLHPALERAEAAIAKAKLPA